MFIHILITSIMPVRRVRLGGRSLLPSLRRLCSSSMGSLAELASLPLHTTHLTHSLLTPALYSSAAHQAAYLSTLLGHACTGTLPTDRDDARLKRHAAATRRRRRLRLASEARRERLAAQLGRLRERSRGFALRMETVVNRADVESEAAVRATLADERDVVATMGARCELLHAELSKHRHVIARHLELFHAASERRAQTASQLLWVEWLAAVQRDVLTGAPSKQRAAPAGASDVSLSHSFAHATLRSQCGTGAAPAWIELEESAAHYDDLARRLMAVAASRKELSPQAKLQLCRLMILSPCASKFPLSHLFVRSALRSPRGAAREESESTRRVTRCYSAPLDEAQYTKLAQVCVCLCVCRSLPSTNDSFVVNSCVLVASSA